MTLYELIAKEYKEIFPSSDEKVAFLEELLTSDRLRILDIGCASGELARQLWTPTRQITGIDLDSHMVRVARSTLQSGRGNSLQFHEAEMVSFLSDSAAKSYDAIFCLGNTLAYLDGKDELRTFLGSSERSLSDRGTLVLQLLNYSNPAMGAGFEFPSIETPRVIFKRSYKESDKESKLDFTTLVEDKVGGVIHSYTHYHSPFTISEILRISEEQGFSKVQVFGEYGDKEGRDSDFFNVIVLEK